MSKSAGEQIVYFNGEMVPESQVRIHFHDLGFLDGDAVFDRARTFHGKLFKMEEHLGRLYDSLMYMRIDPGVSKDQMTELTLQVLDANRPLLGEGDDYWLTQRVTRGVPQANGSLKPSLIIDCMLIPFAGRANLFRDGLDVITPSIRRTPPECVSPRVKANNYINLTLADLEVAAQNPDAWALLLDLNGNVTEGEGRNFFIVKDGVVLTPKERFVLSGITRSTVMELARELNIEAREVDIDLYDCYTADESFVTSTSLCVCPVRSINGSVMATGNVPGPVTERLQQAYSGLVGMDVVEQYLSRVGSL